MSSQEIEDICTQFLSAYETRDMETLGRIISNTESLVALGTHQDLEFHGWDAFRESLTHQFSATRDTSIRITGMKCHVCAGERAACASLTADYRGKVSGHDIQLTGLRITFSLEKQEGAWRIIQIHWSAPQEGSLLNPALAEPQISVTQESVLAKAPKNPGVCAKPGTHSQTHHPREDVSHASREAFSVYHAMAQRVSESVNAGIFDFAKHILPYTDKDFTEIVAGTSLDLAAVEEGFTDIVKVTAAGGSFLWAVELVSARDLTPDTVLLITTADVTLMYPSGYQESRKYRISNILQERPPGTWVFLHQHRTTLEEGPPADVA
ncbi:nuclear transport factor 2 family protein [Streptomyces sp. NPDC053431]|uniref:nuclear transport factor 2 family protein n=1 Tax=Streptomyces sp. NPDC053431 TaxID=3365703 RepID=UPI0037D55A56